MKFGKRRKDAEPTAGEDPVVVADAGAPPVPVADRWTVPGGANATVVHERPSFEPPVSDPVYEGSAEEMAPETPAGETVVGGIPRPVYEPQPLTYRPPVPAPPPPAPKPEPVPSAVAEEPVAVVTPAAERQPVMPVGDAAAGAHAPGHAPLLGPTWPEDVQKLAAERPELVVGAAFVGGLLAAMILRRLGN